MAYAALVSLAQTIDRFPTLDRFSISLHNKQQMASLRKHITLFQEFLEDLPQEANSLEGRIRDLTYEAEDIIEHFMSQALSVSRYGQTKAKLNGRQLNKMIEKMDAVTGEATDIRNSIKIKEMQLGESGGTASSSSSRITTTDKNNNEMVGFSDDLLAIMERLCGGWPKLEIIPIVGMGGIGKTTLARNAYDDQLAMEYFDVRAWVTVSQEYSAQEILSVLQVSIKEFKERRQSEESISEPTAEKPGQTIEEKVYKSLKGRRYLIVMDDMWSTKAWDDVRRIFPDDNNGSRVMLTTRLADVAAYPDSSSQLHEMRVMDNDQSWNLLRQKVFPNHKNCTVELEDIGKAIARSCSGLPLAVVVIGGILSTVSKTRASWEEIAKNVNSAVAAKDGQFENILSLSYTHLPHRLRPFFLYMAAFPEDYKIRVSKIIKLWVAEGFVKCHNIRSESYEEEERAAEECLEDLVKRNLLLVGRRKSNGKIKSCGLHDLLRDLCIRKAEEEKFLLHVTVGKGVDGALQRSRNQRRVSITSEATKFHDSVSIRTLLCFQGASPRSTWKYFRLLRVLDVANANSSLPAQVYELFHLRYLACKTGSIREAISNHKNLRILIIYPMKTTWDEYATCLVYLPPGIWSLPQLRHLVSDGFGQLPYSRNLTSALEALQTLSALVNFVCAESILKMIPNLTKLGVRYSTDERYTDYQLHNLVSLHQLEKLKLELCLPYQRKPTYPVWQKVNCDFPRTLKKLTLSAWRLPWSNMTTHIGSLPNLEVLKLRNFACDGEEWETTEGDYTRLKFLLIERSKIKRWITESRHFPSLKCLVLRKCFYLEEIPDDVGEIPTLELIDINGCNKSLVASAKRIQEDQQDCGNDALQVRY